MRDIVKGLLFIAILLGIYGCQNKHLQEALPGRIQLQKTYYSQVGIHYEKGRHLTTNYSVGIFMPVNTAVKLVEFGRKNFIVTDLKTGEQIDFVNVPKHTNWTLVESFDKLFGPEKVSLLKFNAAERSAIENGEVTEGMSKDAVIVSRGYPPSHETPSLKRDQWKYWKNRWDTIIVKFKNDHVVSIKD